MNQYQNAQAPAWGDYYQDAGQQTQTVAPQWAPYQMQQWTVTQPGQPNQYYGPGYDGQQWLQGAQGQQGYQPQQWPAPDVTLNRQAWQAQVAQEEGYGPAGVDISAGGILFALFLVGFIVWFGWRRRASSVNDAAGVPVTRNDRRMLSLAESLNKLCNKS